MHSESGYMSSPERGGTRGYPSYAPPGGSSYEDPYYAQGYGSRTGSITPVIDEEARWVIYLLNIWFDWSVALFFWLHTYFIPLKRKELVLILFYFSSLFKGVLEENIFTSFWVKWKMFVYISFQLINSDNISVKNYVWLVRALTVVVVIEGIIIAEEGIVKLLVCLYCKFLKSIKVVVQWFVFKQFSVRNKRISY